MDPVAEDEPEPIKLKSIKDHKTFTVPRNDRVRDGTFCFLWICGSGDAD